MRPSSARGTCPGVQRSSAQALDDAPEGPAAQPAPSTATLVMIAEDNDSDVLMVRRTLRKIAPDSTLEVVRNGADAIRRLTSEPFPHLLLLDLHMPKVDGFETLAAIRSQRELDGVLAVVWSSSAAPEDRMRCLDLGATEYVTKPTSPSALRCELSRLIARCRT